MFASTAVVADVFTCDCYTFCTVGGSFCAHQRTNDASQVESKVKQENQNAWNVDAHFCKDEPPQETFLESHHKVTSNTLAISSASVQSESKQGKDLFNYAIVKKVRWCLNIKERSAHLHFILADHYDGFKADLVLFNAMTEAQFHACKELNPLVEGFVTSSGTSLELARCGSIIRVWSHDLGRFAQVPFIADAKMTVRDLVH